MNSSRRKLLGTAVAGVAGLGVASKLAANFGLVPPDSGGIYGPGETLTYAAHRLLTRDAMAREFPREQISAKPFVNGPPFASKEYKQHRSEGFANWKLTVEGAIDKPTTFTLGELKAMPSRSHITQLACEEGWSYIGEWTGVPLAEVLDRVGVRPEAKYVYYASMEEGWDGSVDMEEARHPQTLLAHGMNGGEIPDGLGAPLRMRIPRQLGYKSVKYIHRILVTDRPEKAFPGGSYAWYAGI